MAVRQKDDENIKKNFHEEPQLPTKLSKTALFLW